MAKAEATVEELVGMIERGELRLTSLAAVIRGTPVKVRGQKKPIELLFNLDHPEELAVVTEVHEEGNGAEEGEEAELSKSKDLQDVIQMSRERISYNLGSI